MHHDRCVRCGCDPLTTPARVGATGISPWVMAPASECVCLVLRPKTELEIDLDRSNCNSMCNVNCRQISEF